MFDKTMHAHMRCDARSVDAQRVLSGAPPWAITLRRTHMQMHMLLATNAHIDLVVNKYKHACL